MMSKTLSCFILIVLFLCTCKRDKLKGDDEKLAGTWKWAYTDGGFSGGGPPFDPTYNRTLVILKKGKYKYSTNSKKLGHGILTIDHGMYKFLNREILSDDDLNGKKILRYHGDTIDIADAPCCDMYVAHYIKQK